MARAGLDYRRAGLLRRMGPEGGAGVRWNVGVRVAWNGLVREGLAEQEGGLYRRTGPGEALLRAYDAGLGEEEVGLLRLVRDSARAARGHWLVHRLAGAGLIALRVSSQGTPEITEAGLAALALGEAAATAAG